MSSKKAQFEVIGLLVIVIFITLTILFVVQFIILKEPSFKPVEHKESQFASNFLNAFIETTALDCYNLKMKSLLHDCVSNTELSRVKCENLMDSCEYLNYTSYTLLKKIMIDRNKAFSFKIVWPATSTNYVLINNSMNLCNDPQWVVTKEAKVLPLKIDQKDIELQLTICLN